MPGTVLPPNQAGIVGGNLARTERIERRTIAPLPNPPERMIFSYPGALSNGIESPPWYVPRSGHITVVRVSLLSSATITHTIALNVNGTQQETFTLTSGNKTAQHSTDIGVGFTEYVTIETVTVADSNMTVEVLLQ